MRRPQHTDEFATPVPKDFSSRITNEVNNLREKCGLTIDGTVYPVGNISRFVMGIYSRGTQCARLRNGLLSNAKGRKDPREHILGGRFASDLS